MRVIVINLDRSPERLEAFRSQAIRLGFAFERLAAVDAMSIRHQRARLTPGEVACFESHRLVWQSLVDSGEPWLAVFEDDAIIAPSATALLATAEWIPAGVDLVKLETFNARIKIAPRSHSIAGARLHRLQSTHCGSAGYILSRRTAERLLDRSENYTRPVDIFMFDPEQKSARDIRVAQMIPALCIQERFLAEQAERTPEHEGLITRSEVEAGHAPGLSKAEKRRREVRRILQQVARPRSLLKIFVPSQRMVVPFADS